MDSRMNRYKQKRIYRKIKRKKAMVILCIMILLIIGIIIVDNSFIDFMCVDDKRVFDYRYTNDTYVFQLFGNDHMIEKETVIKYKELLTQKLDNITACIRKAVNKIK